MVAKNTKYKVMIVEDHDDVRGLVRDIVAGEGHEPVTFSDGASALNYLKEQYNSTAMVLSDINVKGVNGLQLLQESHKLDSGLPFYLVSDFGRPEHVAFAARHGLDGYINKNNLVDDIPNLTQFVLATEIPTRERKLFLKGGGSMLDFFLKQIIDKGMDPRKDDSLRDRPEVLNDVLQTLISYQTLSELDCQVILVVGGGPANDITKAWSRLAGSRMADYFDDQSPKDLLTNARALAYLLGDKASLVTPGRMTGREPLDGSGYGDLSSSVSFAGQLSLDKLYDKNKILIIPYAPRHLTLGHEDLVSETDGRYSLVHPSYSDAHTVLISRMFNAEIILLKRADNIYRSTPYKGYSEGPSAWWWAQKLNGVVGEISYADVLAGEISRKGAFDEDEEHLMDKVGLRLAQKLGPERIYLCHISPHEMGVDTGEHRKRHVVTTDFMPDQPEAVTRRLRLLDIVLGEATTGYMYRN